MIHITKIKYKRKILVRQPLDVFNIRGTPENKKIIILPDSSGVIDLSEHEYPYHIIKSNNELFICFQKHDRYKDDIIIIWESEESLKDRVLSLILDR